MAGLSPIEDFARGETMDTDSPSTGLDPVDVLAEEYVSRRRRGESPTPAEYAARYPELAARILVLFPALEMIERLKPGRDEAFSRPGTDDAARGPFGVAGHPARLGDYHILRELGHGGMGVVYEAEHESLKSRVALKVAHLRFRADPTYLRRFQTEARSAARLHHTNIVPVFDFGEHEGICYYAMQFIAGVGLDQVLDDVRRLRGMAGAAGAGPVTVHGNDTLQAASRGLLTGQFKRPTAAPASPAPHPPMTVAIEVPGASTDALAAAPVAGSQATPSSIERSSADSSLARQSDAAYFREVARLGAQVADALDYAHLQGVIHRDIKPSNLLLDAQGNIWVADFGLAKLVEGDELSKSHELVGTLRFMAPERFRGVTDRRGDIYALGAALYELLTLKPAFAQADQVQLIDQITHQPPTTLRQHDPHISRDLETLILKALAKDPADRFATAGELRDELRRFLESRPIRSRRSALRRSSGGGASATPHWPWPTSRPPSSRLF